MRTDVPVNHFAAGDTRKAISSAISSGSPYREMPAHLSQFHRNSVFGIFLAADFEGVAQQKVGAWRVYRPNLFSESMVFG